MEEKGGSNRNDEVVIEGAAKRVFGLFLRMVVWQPFCDCWRLIIARVAEMHVAYHM